ncbi:MAG TPA: hydroxyisourate hydrolase [Xanthomonadales bacterium]|nr:hydroxyisourate hydrolase [Xanthomonadales bacterium]
MGALTTHILDTSSGSPGAGVRLDLYRLDGERRELLSAVTNLDGRCDAPLLQGDDFRNGHYELVFHAGEYFSNQEADLTNPPFFDEVVIRFAVADAEQHYHVPLLISPYGYTTYRGS